MDCHLYSRIESNRLQQRWGAEGDLRPLRCQQPFRGRALGSLHSHMQEPLLGRVEHFQRYPVGHYSLCTHVLMQVSADPQFCLHLMTLRSGALVSSWMSLYVGNIREEVTVELKTNWELSVFVCWGWGVRWGGGGRRFGGGGEEGGWGRREVLWGGGGGGGWQLGGRGACPPGPPQRCWTVSSVPWTCAVISRPSKLQLSLYGV